LYDLGTHILIKPPSRDRFALVSPHDGHFLNRS
jgi:hypothetical protein